MNASRSAAFALLGAANVACAASPPSTRTQPSIVVSEAPSTPTFEPEPEPSSDEKPPKRDPLAPSLEPPIFPSILFADSDGTIPEESRSLIEEIATELRERPELMLEVNGHSEASEPSGLGWTRAKIVSARLTRAGISAKRLRIVDREDKDPVSRDPAQNRRVSFRPYEASRER